MVISLKMLDAVQAKGVVLDLDLKSLFHCHFLVSAGKESTERKKADEQMLHGLILSWELVTAMSAEFAGVSEAVDAPPCPSWLH